MAAGSPHVTLLIQLSVVFWYPKMFRNATFGLTPLPHWRCLLVHLLRPYLLTYFSLQCGVREKYTRHASPWDHGITPWNHTRDQEITPWDHTRTMGSQPGPGDHNMGSHLGQWDHTVGSHHGVTPRTRGSHRGITNSKHAFFSRFSEANNKTFRAFASTQKRNQTIFCLLCNVLPGFQLSRLSSFEAFEEFVRSWTQFQQRLF